MTLKKEICVTYLDERLHLVLCRPRSPRWASASHTRTKDANPHPSCAFTPPIKFTAGPLNFIGNVNPVVKLTQTCTHKGPDLWARGHIRNLLKEGTHANRGINCPEWKGRPHWFIQRREKYNILMSCKSRSYLPSDIMFNFVLLYYCIKD